jgi:hypothetical protein
MHQSLKPCCILCSVARAVVQIAVVPPYLIYTSPCMVWYECQCGRSVNTCIWYDMNADVLAFNFVLTSENRTAPHILSALFSDTWVPFLCCAVYCVSSIKFSTMYSLTFLQPHCLVGCVPPPRKTHRFKVCYYGNKCKEASDCLIRVFKPRVY